MSAAASAAETRGRRKYSSSGPPFMLALTASGVGYTSTARSPASTACVRFIGVEQRAIEVKDDDGASGGSRGLRRRRSRLR